MRGDRRFADEAEGQVPAGFIVPQRRRRDGPPPRSKREVVKLVRDAHRPGRRVQGPPDVVKRLPKTRSGKILRGTMRQIADGETWKMPATIEDPAVLDEIAAAMTKAGK